MNYTEIAPSKVISAYIDAFRRAGFSVASRKLAKAAYGPATLEIIFSFDAVQPPYKATIEYWFSPATGKDKHSQTTVYAKGNYLTVADAGRQQKNEAVGNSVEKARLTALADAEASMGEHQRPSEYAQAW